MSLDSPTDSLAPHTVVDFSLDHAGLNARSIIFVSEALPRQIAISTIRSQSQRIPIHRSRQRRQGHAYRFIRTSVPSHLSQTRNYLQNVDFEETTIQSHENGQLYYRVFVIHVHTVID